MAKHTQAHITRTIPKNQSTDLAQRTLGQMTYYMGAKLIEIGVNPKSAIYRWSVKKEDNSNICTYSAYWGQSKERLLSGEEPLTGTDLIDCARANAKQGVKTTAKLCGYAEDISRFQEALKEAAHEMGIEIKALRDLMSDSQKLMGAKGIDVAPDTSASL